MQTRSFAALIRSPYDAEIARLAIPAFGTLVAEPLYVLVDTAIVGRLGTDQLAGLALASTLLLSAHSFLIFLAYGTTAAVARLIGAENETEAAEQSTQGLWLAALLGIAVSVGLYIFGRPLMVLLGGSGQSLAEGMIYLRISLIGLPFLLIALAGGGSFNGRQDTRTPLIIAVAAAVANLGIELFLINVLGFGIGASALSTVIAQIGAGTALTIGLLRWSRSQGVSTKPDFVAMGQLMNVGRALMLRAVALRGSFTLGAAVAARIGVAELAAHQVALQVWSTLALGLDAVAIAGQALTGRWLGAGVVEKAKGAARRMIQIDVGFGAIAGLTIFLTRDQLASLFSNDPEVIAATGLVLVWVALAEPLNGYVFALDGILIGAGDMDYLGKTMLLSAAIFAGLAWAVLEIGASLNLLWAALTFFMMLRAFFLWRRWRTDRWAVVGASIESTTD